jgi:hypothetical protein
MSELFFSATSDQAMIAPYKASWNTNLRRLKQADFSGKGLEQADFQWQKRVSHLQRRAGSACLSGDARCQFLDSRAQLIFWWILAVSMTSFEGNLCWAGPLCCRI